MFSLTIVFHALILASVIPYDIVWGGRLGNAKEMVLFEILSIGLNTLFLFVILIQAGIIRARISSKLIRGFIWGMLAFFLLNTLGNLASESAFEKAVFTPVTLILSICLLIVALSNRRQRIIV